ncbi:Callose synthase 12 [Acorus calamus]|uniref:Callose synthase 12 n=1 Tax=Acorus calamus TaxID=4465 RepID=A0AAV9CBG1_ACOCL|nr:Callose synthase 12 [Acorus calamus]
MFLKAIAAAAWVIAFAVLYTRAWDQHNRDRRWSTEANNRLIYFLEAAGVFVLPEALATVLFIIPWVRNFLEKANWKILYALTWWFQSRTFVGRGLREGIVDNVKYSLFWAVLKITRIQFKWHEFFTHTNRLAVGLMWAPVVLIYLMDLQIWYTIFSAFVGALVGLFSHLGEIRNVDQLRLRFQFFSSALQFNLLPRSSCSRRGGRCGASSTTRSTG